MKRDMELAKNVLFYVEEHDELPSEIGTCEKKAVEYHIRLLIEAELLSGGNAYTAPDGNIILENFGQWRLTWAGHEFVDAARNGTVWNKAMQTVKAAGGAITFAALTDLLKKLVAENLGL